MSSSSAPADPPAVHLVVSSVYPAPGGMQDSALRVAAGFAADGCEVVLYTYKQPPELCGPAPEHAGIEVVHLSSRVELLLEPFTAAGGDASRVEGDRQRTELVLLRGELERRLNARRDCRHLLVSFYATSAGLLAQQAADRLGLPHLASFRGTDYARDAFAVDGRLQVACVVDRARAIVTTNREQAEGLRRVFGARQPIHVIHNAMEGLDRPCWTPPPVADRVRLLSDSGLSGRKLTQVLLRAVARLADRGLPVELALLGGISWPRETEYWQGLRRDYEARYPGVFRFREHVPRAEIDALLRESHLYCSATLSEGCSLSRVRALTLGIPIVTTRCGALVELAEDCDHVLLAPPGDGEALADRLEEAVRRTLAGELRPDPARIADWRRHFRPEREREDWRAAVAAALGD